MSRKRGGEMELVSSFRPGIIYAGGHRVAMDKIRENGTWWRRQRFVTT